MESFKYLAIVEWAKEEIRQKGMKSGDPFFSENELGELHKVSRQTVRQALNLLESEGVIYRKRGSGTFVKNGIAEPRQKSSVIGVVSTYFSDYIFPSIVTGMEQVIRKNESTMQIAITRNLVSEESRALESILERDVDGLIVEPSKSALPNPNYDIYRRFRERGIPVVFFNAKYPGFDFPCVSMDDVKAGEIITDHLFDLGHERICGVFSLDDIQGHKRYEGFMKSFIKHGRGDAEQRVIWYGTSQRQTLFSEPSELAEELLRDSTAVVCYNDDVAVKLLAHCRAVGINVPEDLSVGGIDDSRLASVCEVPLTTVRNASFELGKAAAERLYKMIEHPGMDNTDLLITPELIVRNSTKRLERA